ncbi:MAG TPA: hypothetical protein VF316_04875 [Polyangiaceae bacterium]
MRTRMLLAAVPVVTVLAVALGLRIGAKADVRAAILHGAPLPKGGGRLAWQMNTMREESSVRETLSTPFRATFHAASGAVEVRGATNEDGVAEIVAEIPGLHEGDALSVDIVDEQGASLGAGAVRWSTAPREEHHDAVHATLRKGEVRLDVMVWGARITPGRESALWIRASDRDGHAVKLVSLTTEADLGVMVTHEFHAECNDSTGVLHILPETHVAGLRLRAKGEDGKTGEWYGALPVAPGALWVDVPTHAPSGPLTLKVTAANARTRAYVEVEDEAGRVFAASPALVADGTDPFPHASITTPPLQPGLHWIVVSGEPDGATHMTGATRALPVVVGGSAGSCDDALAGRTPVTLPRFTALDGFEQAGGPARERRSGGRRIALAAVLLGAVLELVLLAKTLRQSRLEMAAVDAAMEKKPGRDRALDILVGVLLVALGFAFLGALLEWQTR